MLSRQSSRSTPEDRSTKISDALQLTPKRTRPAGPPRKPPFDWSHWSYEFTFKAVRELGVLLEAITEQLERHKSFFHRIVDEGGRVELFCGIHAAGNWDEVLDYELMRQLSDLWIDLRLDGCTPKSLHQSPGEI